MRFFVVQAFLLLASVAALSASAQTLFFAGDSTLDDYGLSLGKKGHPPYQSWGTTLRDSMKAGCQVRNFAKSGDSTRNFAKTGRWANLIKQVGKGDFVGIQFGHNDQKRSNEYYLKTHWSDPKGAFRETVRGWVREVREKGATPILISPICRGTFDKSKRKLVDPVDRETGVCLGSYRDALRELSEELKCDYVDMNGLTRQLLESVGKDEAMKFFVISTGLVLGKDGEPSRDVTHPVKAGAEAFARLFIEDVKKRKLPVAEMFKSNAGALDGVPVAEPLAESAILVRDVAVTGGFCRIDREAEGLALERRIENRGGAVFYDVTLSDLKGGDRAVTMAFARPVRCDGGVWFDSPRTKRPFDGAKGELREVRQSKCGAGGFSRWPFIALTDAGRGLALGVDPRLPGFFRVGVSPQLGLAYISYDFALVPEKRTARVGFVEFPFEAKDGWRGALEAYQRLFPEFNAVHQRRQGLWMAFNPISKVEGWEDFGFAIKEGDGEIGWDDAHGITTYRYTEPTTWWMTIGGKDGRKQATMSECRARAEELAADGDPKRSGLARAWKACAMKDERGDPYGRILDTPWCNGIVWNMNCAPGLGPDCEFQRKIGGPDFSRRYSGEFPQGLDGEYVDSAEMYVTAELDFNRSNFSGMATPLVFDGRTFRPGVFKGMMSYEYVRGAHDRVRKIGRRMMANATPCGWCWLAPYLDVMGTESNWHAGKWSPPDDRRLMYSRALCGAKPFCFLQNTDFSSFTQEMSEKYMQRSLAYGMYPGFFSPGASSTTHYFSNPTYYNRDRPLFKKYIPLCRLVGEAGWRAVNRLTVSDSDQVISEQFGDNLATVFNLSDKAQRVNIRSLQGRTAEELVVGGDWRFVGGTETVEIPPETVRVLRFK